MTRRSPDHEVEATPGRDQRSSRSVSSGVLAQLDPALVARLRAIVARPCRTHGDVDEPIALIDVADEESERLFNRTWRIAYEAGFETQGECLLVARSECFLVVAFCVAVALRIPLRWEVIVEVASYAADAFRLGRDAGIRDRDRKPAA